MRPANAGIRQRRIGLGAIEEIVEIVSTLEPSLTLPACEKTPQPFRAPGEAPDDRNESLEILERIFGATKITPQLLIVVAPC